MLPNFPAAVKTPLIAGLAALLVLSGLPAYASPAPDPGSPEDHPAPTISDVVVADRVAPVEDHDTFEQAPEQIAVNGSIVVTAQEEFGGGESWLAVEDGPFIPLDSAAMGEALIPGQPFAGTIEIPDPVQSELQETIDDVGTVSATEALEVVSDWAEANSTAPVLAGKVEAPPQTAAAPAPKTHTADVVIYTPSSYYYGGGPGYNAASVEDLLENRVGPYWNNQTDGIIAGLTVDQIETVSLDWGYGDSRFCKQVDLWEDALDKFNRNPSEYQGVGSRHLIVLVDSSCSGTPGNGGMAGLAGIGSLNRGGIMWLNMVFTNGGAASKMTSTTAHEFGHNLGLHHSQARVCTGSAIDAPTRLVELPGMNLKVQKPVAPCVDYDYGDRWSVMGSQFLQKPTALPMAQRQAIGVLPAGAITHVDRADGDTQSFKIADAGLSSGVRGLEIDEPAPGGGKIYIEFRNNGGQDSGSGITSTPTQQCLISGSNGCVAKHWVSTGVRVVKGYPMGQAKWSDGVWRPEEAPRSSVIEQRKSNGQHQTLKPGDSLSTIGGVHITAGAVEGNTSWVTVDFRTPPFADIPVSHPFFEEITWLKEEGITTGAGGLYVPNSPVTREQMAAFIFRMIGPEEYEWIGASEFDDVTRSNEFFDEIHWMLEEGLTTGIASKSGGIVYNSKGKVTREQMAAFLFRLSGADEWYEVLAPQPFTDVSESSQFYTEIQWLFETGVTTGSAAGGGKIAFSPKFSVTRGQMAAFLYRYDHNVATV